METARRLFFQRGSSNVGINDVIAEAGVARMTLYNNFTSKDELIAAVYTQTASEILQNLTEKDNDTLSEFERVDNIFNIMRQEAADENFRGCWLTHASYQSADAGGGVFDIVSNYKRSLRQHVYGLLVEGRPRRDELADQLLLLMDGAMTEAYLKGVADGFSAARSAAAILLGK